jgi:hypothetical protein
LFYQFSNKRFYDNIDAFKNSGDPFKIAIVSQTTHSRDYSYVMQFFDICDLVIVRDGEFHEWHPLNTDTYSRKNVYWYGPGVTKKNNEYIIPFQQHLDMMQNLYQIPQVKDQLDRLTPYQPKPMSFDALLGRPRPPRVFIMSQIKKYGLESTILSNIFSETTYTNHPMDRLPGFVWENDYLYAESQDVDHINCRINYHGKITSLGNIIPISTYNQTAFSILSETEHNNSVYMLTEKTAKVAIGRRVFVAFAGCGFLQLIRDAGFQTFDGIIDESYDQIENDQDRWHAAFDQVIRLCEVNQADVLSQARPVLEHNYNLIMQHPWRRIAEKSLTDKLTDLIKYV